MTELTDIEKASLRSLSNTQPQDTIYRWRQALKRRWDPPAALALQNFMNTKYTVNMARSGMSVVQYFATKLRLAKEAGFDNVHQQLLAVWNGIDIEIRKHIDEPDETTSIDRFRRRLEDKERLWKEEMTTQRLRAQGNFLPTRCWNDEYRPTAPQPRFANVPYSPSPSGQILSSNRPFIPAGQGNYGGNRPPTQMAGIGPSPQRLQLTAEPSGTPNPTQARSPQRPSTWTPGRRACSKCGGQHMDWEHNYYQNNPTTKPTKAYYLNVLQHEMGDYSPADVAECISAYHAAEEDEPFETPRPSESIPPSPRLMEQHADHRPENQNTEFPAIGGSSWFHGDGGTEVFDVYYHHLVEETPMPTPTDKNLTSLISQRGETENLVQFRQAPGKNPTSLILQRSETAVPGQSGQLDPTSLISQWSETAILDRSLQNLTSQFLATKCHGT